MSKFGWSYPAGCSGPPEGPEPGPVSEAVQEALEAAGVPQEKIDALVRQVDEIERKAAADCPRCMALGEEVMAREHQQSQAAFDQAIV